jgi:mRNA interferase RelE/StbE
MKVSLHPIADKYLNRLNANDRDRIDDAIGGPEKEPPEGDIRPVKGQPGFFRLRIGSYRLLFRINEKGILITHIDP